MNGHLKYFPLYITALSIDALGFLVSLVLDATVVGIPVGIAFDEGLDATFGSAFAVLLGVNGLFSISDILSWRRTPFMVAKLIPFVDYLPEYTTMTFLCVRQKIAKENPGQSGGLFGAALNIGLAATTGGTSEVALAAAGGASSVLQSRQASRQQRQNRFQAAHDDEQENSEVQPSSPGTASMSRPSMTDIRRTNRTVPQPALASANEPISPATKPIGKVRQSLGNRAMRIVSYAKTA